VSCLAPPSEENLLQNSLWPETEKLYGHDNELYAVAASPDGSLLASACKVTTTTNTATTTTNTAATTTNTATTTTNTAAAAAAYLV